MCRHGGHSDGNQQDIRYACRSIRSKPGYAAAVILLMALGIGATTAAFSAVNGILWIRFAYPDADWHRRCADRRAV